MNPNILFPTALERRHEQAEPESPHPTVPSNVELQSFIIRRSQPWLRERVAIPPLLFGSFDVLLRSLLSLLLGGQGVDLLARLHEAAIVLLLELGADIVEGHEGRCAVNVILNLLLRVRNHVTGQAKIVLTGELARRGVPGTELTTEPPERGVVEVTRMRRPNLSTLGSSDDQARFRTDGRCGG